MKNSEANKSKGKEIRDTIIYLVCWIIGFGIFIIGGMYFIARFTEAIPSKKDIRERNIEILDAARIYKGEEYTYTTLDYLERRRGIDINAEHFPMGEVVDIKGIEIYDTVLKLYLKNYKYFFPEMVELHPEIQTMTAEDVYNQIRKNKTAEKKQGVPWDKETAKLSPLDYLKYFSLFKGCQMTNDCLKAYDMYLEETGELLCKNYLYC